MVDVFSEDVILVTIIQKTHLSEKLLSVYALFSDLTIAKNLILLTYPMVYAKVYP